MSKDKGLKPGQIAPKSGQYQEIGPRGGKGHEVTVVKGEKLLTKLFLKKGSSRVKMELNFANVGITFTVI